MHSRTSRWMALASTVMSGSLLVAQNISINDDDRRPATRPAVKETAESKKAKADRDALADSLFNRAYSLTKQTTDAEKSYILSRLAEASAKSHPQRSQ
jgi:hypothetical protein